MFPPLNKDNPIPLYYQMKEQMKEQILSGRLKPGQKLPTEKWYCEHFGVSRVTVRKAIAALVDDGLLERAYAQGAVVSQQRIERELRQVKGLADSLRKQGKKVTSRVLFFEDVYAGQLEEQHLKVPGGTRILLLKRLRYADGIPLVVQSVRLRLELLSLLESADLENESLYALLEENGVILDRAEQSVTAHMPSREQQKLLDVGRNTPLLYIRRTSYLPTGVPVEFSESWYVASEFTFTVTLHR